jgi:LmbE family N-acetylglucosaminyl deacetylase
VLGLIPERLTELVLLGAHCDDIAIGAGAGVLELCRAHPGLRVTALVCTGAGGPREAEERAALRGFTAGAKLELTVLDLPDTRLPEHAPQVKAALRAIRERVDPDLLLGPPEHDAHQDHRTLARLVPTVFRDHLTLGYEILKWESDLVQPRVYFPVPAATLAHKIDLLLTHYPSQRDHPWFEREAFAGLARVRGVQCHAHYAEGYHLSKLVLGPGPLTEGGASCASC